jgi:hypothetical protein
VYCVIFVQFVHFPSYSNVNKMLTARSLKFSEPYSAFVFIKRDVCVVECTKIDVKSNFLRRKLDSAIYIYIYIYMHNHTDTYFKDARIYTIFYFRRT